MLEATVRTMLALIVVLGLMALLAWAFRRFGGVQWLGNRPAPLIRVLATASLGSRKAISLVSVCGEVMIIGSSANELVRLGTVSDPARVAALHREAAMPTAGLPPRAAVAEELPRR